MKNNIEEIIIDDIMDDFIKIKSIVDEKLKQYMDIKGISKEDILINGICESYVNSPYIINETYFYKDEKILTIKDGLIQLYFS